VCGDMALKVGWQIPLILSRALGGAKLRLPLSPGPPVPREAAKQRRRRIKSETRRDARYLLVPLCAVCVQPRLPILLIRRSRRCGARLAPDSDDSATTKRGQDHEHAGRSADMVLTRHWLLIFADFGEIAVIGPAFLAACAALLLYRRRRDAILWTLAIAACTMVTLISKTFLGRFEISLFDHNFRSGAFPSGHASVSFVFYVGLATLLWRGSRSPLPRALAMALVALQAMIVISVYLLHWHPVIDIVAGLLLGAACLGAAYCSAAPRPATIGELGGLVVVVAAAIMTFHGERVDDKKLVDRLLTGTIGEAVPSTLPAAERRSPVPTEQPG
jgi:hypothetical protein